jgi:hypothetical protein
VTVPPILNVTQGSLFSSIQAAIDAADAGDTIQVAAGTYTENLLVGKSLSINGPNSELQGNNDTRGDEGVLKGNIRVEANDVTIAGMLIDGTDVAQTTNLTMRGILVGNTGSRENVTIVNNVIQNWITGVSLAGGASFPWNNHVRIEGNKLISASIGSTENVGALMIVNNTFESTGLGLGSGAVLAAPITGNSFSGSTGRYVSAASDVDADFADIVDNNTFEKGALTVNAVAQWYDRAVFCLHSRSNQCLRRRIDDTRTPRHL